MAEITKIEIEKLMKISGEVRGVTLKTDAEFITREKGKEGVKKLELELERISCPIKYNEIESMNFYPIGLRIVSLYAIKSLFNFDEEKIKEIGMFAPKTSLIIKFFMQYFLSLEKTIGELSKIWKKHYTVGDMSPVEVDEKNKIVSLKLENANFDPIFCCYLTGYLSKVLEMIVGNKVSCQETKCAFRGDNFHEYLFKW
jgi:predicted hydrocarbon binding protein